jgi:predicted ATP-grasp superfamily ATP-dependent carboligase
MKRILITGGRNPSALELVRLLYRSNVQLWLADSMLFPVGRYSRYIAGYWKTPSVAQHPTEYLLFLKQKIIHHRIDLLIPSYEEVFFLAEYASVLEGCCEIYMDNFSKLINLHHKAHFTDMVKGMSVSAPVTYLIDSPSEAEQFQALANDYVFKPVYSRFATHVLICPSPRQFKRLYEPKHYPWIAQKYVKGKEYCSYSIVYRGQVKAHVTYEHPYNLGRGSGIYYRVVEHPVIDSFVQEFCQKYNYHGQIGFDFMEDATGKTYVLECNPRTVNGIHLFSPEDNLLACFLGNTTSGIYPQSKTPRTNLLTFLTYNLVRAIKERQFRQWGVDLLRAKDVIYRQDDPLPLFGQNLTLLEFCWNSLRQRLPLADVLSYDIAWMPNSDKNCYPRKVA